MWIHVLSGLTSRCNTLADAYDIMKSGKAGKRLTIIWPIDHDCGIHYYEVFERNMFSDIKIRVIEVGEQCRYKIKLLNKFEGGYKALLRFGKRYYTYAPPKEIGWSDQTDDYLNKVAKKISDDLFCRNKVEKGMCKLLVKAREKQEIYICAFKGVIMQENKDIDLSVIKFRKDYWKKVNKILMYNENLIGVHIRRTDHTEATERSSTEMFVLKMNEIIEEQKDIKFFLSTDDRKEQKYLKNLYGSRIIIQNNKKWGRTDSGGMKSAIIDCLCLSRCNYILGSYKSNFSKFAAEYGGKKLIICDRKDKNK